MTQESFFVYNAQSTANLIITVEHAGNEWPEDEPIFGMPNNWHAQHYAYDFGVKELALKLGKTLNCPVVLSRYSRVLIDLNRIVGAEDIIRTSNDGVDFPMNANPQNLQDQRIARYYVPYHAKIRELLDYPARKHVSIHSYIKRKMTDHTGFENPWQLGIQYPCSTPMAQSALAFFGQLPNVVVGDNLPYNLRQGLPGAISLHAAAFGRDTVELEFRDDQFKNPDLDNFWYEETSKWLAKCVLTFIPTLKGKYYT